MVLSSVMQVFMIAPAPKLGQCDWVAAMLWSHFCLAGSTWYITDVCRDITSTCKHDGSLVIDLKTIISIVDLFVLNMPRWYLCGIL